MSDAKEEERVRELLKEEVEWWGEEEEEEDVKALAMFKGFSGQRQDWEPRFLFWRELIIKVARHLRTFIIRPSQLTNVWFRRRLLSPLCLPQVLLEMYRAGDLMRISDLPDPKSGWLSFAFWKAANLLRFSTPDNLPQEDTYILPTLLKERALEVVSVLSDNHWTSSCIITLTKFHRVCRGSLEASALLSYLSSCGKAKYLVINKNDLIEGVKVSLTPIAVSAVKNLDCDVLHLIWTAEILEQQIHVIDQRCGK